MNSIILFPIDAVELILMHSMAHRTFTPSYGQMFEGKYRKDGKDIDLDNFDGEWPKSDDVDLDKIPAQVFFVKDRGAYIMAATEVPLLKDDGAPNESFVAYADGHNPDEPDWDYSETSQVFGGDDFADVLPIDWIRKAISYAKKHDVDWMFLRLTEDQIEVVFPRDPS